MRLLILGARGSGKSLHGRHLAKKLGIFHISFKERLQELIMLKTKGKKVGPEYEEDQEEPGEETHAVAIAELISAGIAMEDEDDGD